MNETKMEIDEIIRCRWLLSHTIGFMGW